MSSDGSLSDIFGDCTDCGSWMGGWVEEAAQLSNRDNPLNEYLAYSVICSKSNRLVGSVGCSFYEDTNETGITYFTGSSYRGKGYATSAACIYSNYFLEHYKNIPYLIATIQTSNAASCKVAEKAGFLLKETKLYKDINDKELCMYNFYIKQRNL